MCRFVRDLIGPAEAVAGARGSLGDYCCGVVLEGIMDGCCAVVAAGTGDCLLED